MSDVYDGKTVTTKSNFKVVDVTHKPKRMQADNIKKAIGQPDKSPNEPITDGKVPTILTIERAIKYFEDNSKDEFTDLYKATVQWLKDYLTIKSNYKAQGIRTDLKRIVEQLEWCEYECIAGPLRTNVEFIRLKELAGINVSKETETEV